MTPAATFARKEILGYLRTWRLKLLAIPVVFFALTGPVLAYFTPEIVAATLGAQNLTVPDPVWTDVYAQWAKNLQQIVPLLVIVIAAGSIAGECTSGTIIPVVASGFPRSRVVLVSFLVHCTAGSLVVAVGTVITWAAALPLFPYVHVASALRLLVVALTLVVVLVAIATAASAAMSDTLGAIGVAMAAFFVLAALSIWPWARHWTPVGLLSGLNQVVTGSLSDVARPIATGLLLSMTCVFAAVRIFDRRELAGA